MHSMIRELLLLTSPVRMFFFCHERQLSRLHSSDVAFIPPIRSRVWFLLNLASQNKPSILFISHGSCYWL